MKVARSELINTGVADALKLSVTERVQLVAEIWDSIASSPAAIEIKPETLKLLRKRLDDHRNAPNSGSPWSEVKKRILNTDLK